MNILIAEDSEIERKEMFDLLTAKGHSVLSAGDGADAWKLFVAHAEELDLLLIDWMMPPPDGLEFVKKVRDLGCEKQQYTILLTARVAPDDIIAGLQAGANDYITKPFDIAELLARINVGGRVVALEETLRRRVKELEGALQQVTRLQSLLPICSYCKRIRDDKNYWASVEEYISEHTGARFSHSICPECQRKVMSELDEGKSGSDNVLTC